jgi:Flp pilus assembly protein TadG
MIHKILTSKLSSGAVLRRRSERGASLVEYSFIVIFFLTLLLGIGGFGHALFVYHHLHNVAKEATRYASVRGLNCSDDSSCVASNSASGIVGPTTPADVAAYVASITPSGIDSNYITAHMVVCGVSGTICSPAVTTAAPECNVAATANKPGCPVQVTINYSYNFVFPLIRTTAVSMSSTSDMIILH